MEYGIKYATDIDVSDSTIKEHVANCLKLLDLINVRRGVVANDFAEKLEQVRWAEICSILLCHLLQKDVSNYQAREAEAQARLEDWAGWALVEMDDYDTVYAKHPYNKAQVCVANVLALLSTSKLLASNVFAVPY